MVLPSFLSKSKSPSKDREAPTKSRRPSAAPGTRHSKSRSPSKTPIKQPRISESVFSKKGLRSQPNLRDQEADDTHPLNLLPAEREQKRSVMSGANGEREAEGQQHDPMDVDSETTDGDSMNAPGSGENATINGQNGRTQPPQNTPTAAPPKPSVDAEEFKALGNKYFKAKDYTKAIAEYTKGSFYTMNISFFTIMVSLTANIHPRNSHHSRAAIGHLSFQSCSRFHVRKSLE